VAPAAPTCREITNEDLTRIRAVADYQFREGSGAALFPKGVKAIKSRKTGKVKAIYYNNELLATLKPSDGYLALSLDGGRRLCAEIRPPRYRVIVQEEVAEFIRGGRNLFAKHVVEADPQIRPGEEILITDSKDNILAVGRAVLAGFEMKRFKIGLAARVRKGTD
jgi:predicted RNA-binding protein (TIGR00451 family)